MSRRDRESILDSDPQDHPVFGSVFDDDGADDSADYPEYPAGSGGDDPDDGDHRPRATRAGAGNAGRAATRHAARVQSQQRRRRRLVATMAVLIVVVLGVAVVVIGLPIYHYFVPNDYDGAGSGSVVVTVHANDGASQIADELTKADVVGSQKAFTNAADDNSKSADIQPGSYRLHKHMSADRALAALLDPSSRVDSDTVVTEGMTVVDVEKRLTAARCAGSGGSNGKICGLGRSRAEVTKALTSVSSLGIPTDYLPSGKPPTSAEGFLFPATYTFDDETSVPEALQQMVAKFTDEARQIRFSDAAKALKLSPYQALVVASIAQAEAKYPSDMPKVARVVLNRLQAHQALRVDATSAYAAKLKGLDPSKVIYAQTEGPFNTYRNDGLPPTPIGNPGEAALKAAAHPAAGNWLFYVNGDAQGHLFFTNSETAFAKAAEKCRKNHWGCG